VLRAASDTQAPQGLLVVLPTRSRPIPPRPDFLLIADAVRDPGNLGTMLRTAAAAGVEGFLLPPGAVDPFSPKVVRAGMGAHFRLPVHALEWEEIDQLLQRTALQVFLAAAGRGLAYTQADFRQPLALIVGGEAEGAGDQSRSLSGAQVHIPMPGGMESLNAAVAAAVLLFEVVRQRSST
jgi:TrmH family RNA methyltransferase